MTTLTQFKQGALFSRGEYSDGAVYYPNNLLVFNSSVYICIRQSLGNEPINQTFFELFTGLADISVATSGTGTTPETFTLTTDGTTITLNKPG